MEDTSKQEILEAIGLLADQVEDIRVDLSGVKSDVSGLKADVSGLKADVSGLKADMRSVKNTMVTKDYLDDKLDNFRGDLVGFIRAEDKKVLEKLK